MPPATSATYIKITHIKMNTVDEMIIQMAVKHKTRLQNHCNLLAYNLLKNDQMARKLKKTKPRDLGQ